MNKHELFSDCNTYIPGWASTGLAQEIQWNMTAGLNKKHHN